MASAILRARGLDHIGQRLDTVHSEGVIEPHSSSVPSTFYKLGEPRFREPGSFPKGTGSRTGSDPTLGLGSGVSEYKYMFL